MEEKKLDINSIIGFVLIFLILMWVMYNGQQREAAEKAAQEVTKTEMEAQTASSEAKVVKAVVAATDSLKVSLDTVSVNPYMERFGAFGFAAPKAQAAGVQVLENEFLYLEIDPKGGYLKKALMKNHERFRKNSGEQVVLVDDNNARFNLTLTTQDNRVLQTEDLYFVPVLTQNGDAQELRMQLQAGPDALLEYVYRIKPNDHMLDFEIRSKGLSNVIRTQDPLPLEWQMNTYRNEKSVQYENRYTEVVYEFENGKDDYLGQGTLTSDEVSGMTWVAFKQHFFVSVLLTDKAFDKGFIQSENLVKDEFADTLYLKRMTAKLPLAFEGGELNHKMNWYMGPSDYKTLKAYDRNLDEIVPIGWGLFGWINRFAFIPTFDVLSKFLPYGIAIIILTILVRLAMSPVTYKSYLSQAKMRVLRPEITELNEKFSKDPMKKQQETMKLYSKAGVNPMAGCLPALMQIPVFYALYSFFPAAFILRQKSFLWADDLSSYDSIFTLPFNIPFYGNHVSLFPILASIAIFFYMKMTTGDQINNAQPVQEGMPDMGKIMKIMIWVSPIMMMIFFNNFASGLSLYYFVSNVITIGIMLVIKKFIIDENKIHLQIQENKQKPRKMNRFQQKMQEMMEEAERQKNQPKK